MKRAASSPADGKASQEGTTYARIPCSESESPLYKTDEFRMYCFKVLPCSKRYCHDWTTCPFAHPNEKAKRRDPRIYSYMGIACPEMKKNLQCPRGDSCPYAHNVFEYWLHPNRYRTQLCNDGTSCRRKVCFFAHTVEELRLPLCKPLPNGMTAELSQGYPEDVFRHDATALNERPAIRGAAGSPVSPLAAELLDLATAGSTSPSSSALLNIAGAGQYGPALLQQVSNTQGAGMDQQALNQLLETLNSLQLNNTQSQAQDPGVLNLINVLLQQVSHSGAGRLPGSGLNVGVEPQSSIWPQQSAFAAGGIQQGRPLGSPFNTPTPGQSPFQKYPSLHSQLPSPSQWYTTGMDVSQGQSAYRSSLDMQQEAADRLMELQGRANYLNQFRRSVDMQASSSARSSCDLQGFQSARASFDTSPMQSQGGSRMYFDSQGGASSLEACMSLPTALERMLGRSSVDSNPFSRSSMDVFSRSSVDMRSSMDSTSSRVDAGLYMQRTHSGMAPMGVQGTIHENEVVGPLMSGVQEGHEISWTTGLPRIPKPQELVLGTSSLLDPYTSSLFSSSAVMPRGSSPMQVSGTALAPVSEAGPLGTMVEEGAWHLDDTHMGAEGHSCLSFSTGFLTDLLNDIPSSKPGDYA